MLRNARILQEFAIGAIDGPIGRVKDFYFDDQAWVVRYVVVITGNWLGGHEVLVSPYGLGPPDSAAKTLPARITKEQIRNSPGIDTDQPVSRRYERSYSAYYRYPHYWGGSALWGEERYPRTLPAGMGENAYRGVLRSSSDDDDLHLRGCEAVKGYHVRAIDGDIGQVQGFIVDDRTWSIRYLIVSTTDWWAGHDVLVSPEWLEEIDWAQSEFFTNLDRQAIKACPPYDGTVNLNRDAEALIYIHYGRHAYWQEQALAPPPDRVRRPDGHGARQSELAPAGACESVR